ncbi:MAG TPA: DISARM system helicase DrmA [Caulobacteraceae bacterium]|nr:DISARM system helicase DrmA [Caulobacteraceae bacterium]
MTSSLDVRGEIVDAFRRDLYGPGPADADLAAERLSVRPSRWYLTGFLAPVEDADGANGAEDDVDPAVQDEAELDVEPPDPAGLEAAGGGDDEEPDAPASRRRFLPSSVGLTVLLDPSVTEIEAEVSWGDYRTEPPLDEAILSPAPLPDEIGEDGKPVKSARPLVEWLRAGKTRTFALAVADGRSRTPIPVPDSAAEQYRGGGLVLETHSRVFDFATPNGGRETVRALTAFLVNRRSPTHRFYADVGFAFQARLALACAEGFKARRDLSAYNSEDTDLRLADLHYRDVCEWAVGRNAAAGWGANEDAAGHVTRVWTDPLPSTEVERVAPNEKMAGVTFGMDDLAEAARAGAGDVASALAGLPGLYGAWIDAQRGRVPGLHDAPRREETARRLVDEMEAARARIVAGIAILADDEQARQAFRFMNLAVSAAAKRRGLAEPIWRPFQLAFILLNLTGLADKTHDDREVADLLFFPTGGGKTEAYLGLAAFVIALRRLKAHGVLGAGVAVIMRYTLRLLTLDQLGRAAGVVCALELLRLDPAHQDTQGRALLGDWPIEIGLWVGAGASPNVLGRKGKTDDYTAVGQVRRYRTGRSTRAPAPLKACPWCATAFTADSFHCMPNEVAPTNLEIRCVNTDCDFGRGRALPIVTVDEAIYRRLPAFLIATVDKFAALPWVGETGAFFGHVDRFDPAVGFFGAAVARGGRQLGNSWRLDPPDLIIQDELHLISGPLGTIAALYETAIDQLASRTIGGRRVRPKIVASTATVRRAADQIRALFDRPITAVFPPPGLSPRDSFFAETVPSSKNAARLYVGIAAQGRGPKLVFLRALTTLCAAAQAAYERHAPSAGEARNPADPYMTALCYFNALRELGGARRIVEDEVNAAVAHYGEKRVRLDPPGQPFADRRIGALLEITSRVSTDDVALAKQRLEHAFGGNAETVDVALATNMISVGLDILRLGLMVVQGQPKTAAEYIQATSRVGRDYRRPGLVLAVLNLHKPRDRMHFEQFGNFHRSFYRAVEATSVTPWAARALDRALAAILVAAARHLDPTLTPEAGVNLLKDRPDLAAQVRETVLARARTSLGAAGEAALGALIDATFADWIETADDQSATGAPFHYAAGASPRHLLHMPLARELAKLTAPHQRFVAGRSMRDVEASVAVKVADPWGKPDAAMETV